MTIEDFWLQGAGLMIGFVFGVTVQQQRFCILAENCNIGLG
jgi:hypothetical protein